MRTLRKRVSILVVTREHIYLDTLSFCIDVRNDGLWATNVHNEHGMTSASTGMGLG